LNEFFDQKMTPRKHRALEKKSNSYLWEGLGPIIALDLKCRGYRQVFGSIIALFMVPIIAMKKKNSNIGINPSSFPTPASAAMALTHRAKNQKQYDCC
jgi:hypothetical protein